jgi:hypothetical protein
LPLPANLFISAARGFTRVRALRLAVQDTALSRR